MDRLITVYSSCNNILSLYSNDRLIEFTDRTETGDETMVQTTHIRNSILLTLEYCVIII